MPHITGKNYYATFAGVVISGDQRSVQVDESVDLAETSAGADEAKSYKPTLKDATGTIELVDNSTAGSAIYNALEVGAEGTLVWGPEGTATGKPKFSCVAIITGKGRPYTYNETVTISYTWQRSGDWITNFDYAQDVW